MKRKEDIRRIRVLVAYGDHIQEDVIVELESTTYGFYTEKEKALEALVLLAEAGGLMARVCCVHHGYCMVRG